MKRPNVQLTEHFWLSEFTKSATAEKLGVDNTPNDEQCWHIFQLAWLLEKLRVAWGDGIQITSGIRLFDIKGASSTSAHPIGFAADIVPTNGKMVTFKVFCRNFLRSHNLPFDQLIDEKRADGAEWVHIGLFNRKGEQRRQYLITTDGVNYSPLRF